MAQSASPSHALITGGAGFIGSHLAERLLREGEQVTVIDDFSTGSQENIRHLLGQPGFRVIASKVSTCVELDRLVAEATSVYHLAAAVGVELVVQSPIRTIRTNLDETEAILEAVSRVAVPILLASTSEVYGKSQKSEFAEEDDLLIGPPHLGRWSYACSKLMDEFLAMAYSKEKRLPVIICRLFNTVGPRQTGRYGMVLPRFIKAALRGEPLQVYGDGHQTRCFCYVHDTVEALVRLQRNVAARGEVFNVGSDAEITILDLAEKVCRQLNSKAPIEFVPYDRAYQPGFEDMLRRKPRIEKLARTIQFRPATPLEKIIELTAEQMQSNG
ncbi:MAG: GDP-mannose 4,6-dehydratase [Verrucomicrobiota bacterium]